MKQAVRGAKRSAGPPRVKLALRSKGVLRLIRESIRVGELGMAALMAVSRLYMLRVPSGGISLEWDGDHSWIKIAPQSATITLARRKNSRHPVELTRRCCCETSGRDLCAVHWLAKLRALSPEHRGRLFDFTISQFTKHLRACAVHVGLTEYACVTPHAFKRGMAQDILAFGGSLAVLLRAGDWS